ncbi:MAG: hypothetical protein E7467_05685 [Ruminococcaceae bacterium]|nr:hypothetical protein [Oscillospiraceae bacterium]
MKKFIAMLLIIVLFSGCSTEKPNAEKSSLHNGIWVRFDVDCNESLTLSPNGSFSRSCTTQCHDETGTYTYDTKKQTLEIDNRAAEILFVDPFYLLYRMDGELFLYENIDSTPLKPHTLSGISEHQLCLSVRSFKDGILTVASHEYDRDAAENYKLWKLEAADDIVFQESVLYSQDDDFRSETTPLRESDWGNFGEFLTTAYFYFNEDGTVGKVIFYGEVAA